LLNFDVDTWSRKLNTVKELEQKTKKSQRILLLIKDNAIEDFAKKYLSSYLTNQTIDKIIIHCSGSLTCENIIGVHPLQSFTTNRKYSLNEYKNICFFCEDNKNFDFIDIFPNLPNQNYNIDIRKKHYYHALCVGANNFTTILWQSFAKRMAKEFDVPFEKIQYYLDATATNIKNDMSSALTGPFIRNDQQTINNNLKSLDNDDFKLIYKAFLDFYNIEKD
jgi:predicted short-subunit dehydrogenase-like oxidoreductase (DUF2520 family)